MFHSNNKGLYTSDHIVYLVKINMNKWEMKENLTEKKAIWTNMTERKN